MESQEIEIDVLHCHDQTMLEIGSLIKNANKKIRLIYDSHEMFHAWPLNLSAAKGISLFVKSYVVRKLQIRRELNNAPYIDYLITVCDSIAEKLKTYFKLRRPPLVIRNVPYFRPTPKTQDRIRNTFSILPETKLLVFIAGNLYVNSQNLTQLIDELGNQDLALLIISGNGHGKQYFQEYVTSAGYTNVYFHERVPPHEIIDYLAECDIGVLPYWNKKDLSYWYALPNKLFDYIMAELPVLSTAQPEFKQVVEGNELGVCIDPEQKGAFLKGYQALLTNWAHYTQKAAIAKKVFTWEQEEERLKGLYKQIEEEQKEI
jgi:glycosyltransferase involved in cell wall biosynthesis